MAKGKSAVLWVVGLIALTLLLAPVVSAQKKTVRVGIAINETMPYFEGVMKPQFEALYPDIELEFQYLSWTVDRYVAAYIGGNPPDVYHVGGDKLGSYILMAHPLDEYATTWEGYDDVPPGIIQSATVDGKLYGLPWQFSTRTLQFRKDWFAEAGLNDENPPTTWDELVDYAKKLSRTDADGLLSRQGLAVNTNYIGFSPYLFQAGGDWMSEDLTEATYADEAGVEAITFLQSLFHEHRVSDWTKSLGSFENGDAAMEYAGVYFTKESGYDAWDDVGVALPTTHKDQLQISLPSLWLITDTSEVKDEAWKWIEFDLSLEQVLAKQRVFGGIAPRLSAVHHEPFTDDARWQQLFAGLALSKTVPQASPYFDQMRRTFAEQALSEVIFDGESVNSFAESMRQASVWLAEQLAAEKSE